MTVFELLTATFTADEFNLREDWMNIHAAMAAKNPVLRAVESTDFLQTVTLFATHEAKRVWESAAVAAGSDADSSAQ